MIFLDSWIWIKYFSQGSTSKKAESVIRILSIEGGITSTVSILEVKYRIAKQFGITQANEVVAAIESIEKLHILPVDNAVAHYAADIRLKYYNKKKALSFIDCINLSMAILARCTLLYTGDADFKDIEEIKTVIV